jgi:hypothetical protein
MNEWERRQLEITQNHKDLLIATRSLGENALVEYFSYTAIVGSKANPLVVGVAQQTVLAIQSDASFVLAYIQTCVVIPDPALQGIFCLPAGNVLMQITDTGAGELLYSAAAPASILGGTVLPAMTGIPMLLPIPRLIPPNTNIKVEATQLNSSVPNPAAYSLYVTLSGARVTNI